MPTKTLAGGGILTRSDGAGNRPLYKVTSDAHELRLRSKPTGPIPFGLGR